ncbi:MAG: aminotransferase class V-fold PLP-dependent enzyme [Planctomycetes bacterium]|nr:aminotransferase class V-fold PLP-dependent enzyme [Planctomycetota bacterium]
MTDRPIYLDNNSTTFPAPEAVEAVLPLFGDIYGNPSSTHSFGQKVRHQIELARENVAKLLNCKPGEVVFNSGATEGNNTAIYAALDGMPDRKHIITSGVEHASVLEVIRYLDEAGYRITELSVDRMGHIDLDELKNEISGDTALVSLMWANNETGVINPINAAGDLAKQFGALFHVDAVQAAGKLKIDLKEELAVDYLTISGHKFHGLKGAGALFVREKAPFLPLLRGGHHEDGRRAGTENVMGIVAMGAAAALSNREMAGHVEHMKKMRDRLQSGLLAKCDDVIINGDQQDRLPNTLNAGFKYIDGEALLMMMDAANIAVSAGSACKSGSMEPSHVLMAMNVPLSAIHGSVRFCVSRYTEPEEIDAAVEQTAAIVKRLREMSPFGHAEKRDEGLSTAELEKHKAYFATT